MCNKSIIVSLSWNHFQIHFNSFLILRKLKNKIVTFVLVKNSVNIIKDFKSILNPDLIFFSFFFFSMIRAEDIENNAKKTADAILSFKMIIATTIICKNTNCRYCNIKKFRFQVETSIINRPSKEIHPNSEMDVMNEITNDFNEYNDADGYRSPICEQTNVKKTSTVPILLPRFNLGRKRLNQRIPNAARFPLVIEERLPQKNQYRLSAIITHLKPMEVQEGTGNSSGHYVCDVPNIIAQKKHNRMCYRLSDSSPPSPQWLQSVNET